MLVVAGSWVLDLLAKYVNQNAVTSDLVDNLAQWMICKEMDTLDDR